jgi:DNA polymerase-3 subunit gamma/tau
VKSARPEVDVSLRALLTRIERLERVGHGSVNAVAAEREVPPPRADADESPTATTTATAIAEDLAPLLSWWPAVVDLVRKENGMLGACIAEARPVEVSGEDLTVAFGQPFPKKKAETPEHRAAVTAALHDVTGRRWRLSYELQEELAGAAGAKTLSEEEWLRRFIEEFDAEELPSEEAAPENGAAGEAAASEQEEA